MRATIPKPGVLLVDDDGARYCRSKGYETARVQAWKRYPWATQQLDLRKGFTDGANRITILARMIRALDHGDAP